MAPLNIFMKQLKGFSEARTCGYMFKLVSLGFMDGTDPIYELRQIKNGSFVVLRKGTMAECYETASDTFKMMNGI